MMNGKKALAEYIDRLHGIDGELADIAGATEAVKSGAEARKKELDDSLSRLERCMAAASAASGGGILTIDGGCAYYYGARIPTAQANTDGYAAAAERAERDIARYVSVISDRPDDENMLFMLGKTYNAAAALLSALRAEERELRAGCESMETQKTEELNLRRASLMRERADIISGLEGMVSAINGETGGDIYAIEKSFSVSPGIAVADDCVTEDIITPALGNIKGAAASTLCWELSRHGVLDIQTDAPDDERLVDNIVCVLCRCLTAYPALYKKLLLMNSVNNKDLFGFMSMVEHNSPQLCYRPAETDNRLVGGTEHILRSLTYLLDSRMSLLGNKYTAKHYSDILGYNAANTGNAQPLIFAVIFGAPEGELYGEQQRALERLMQSGLWAGIYFIYVHGGETAIKHGGLKLSYDAKEEKYSYGGMRYSPRLLPAGFDLDTLLGRFALPEEDSRAVIPFDDIVNDEDFDSSPRRREYSARLTVPIGRLGANAFDLELQNGKCHIISCGRSRSGKSSLVKQLLLAASLLYSPAELEIYLILMQKHDFDIFKDCGLPHLKAIVTGDNVTAATDLIGYFRRLIADRQAIISGYDKIESYNAAVPADKRLPRVFLVVDEYQFLVESSERDVSGKSMADVLEDLAKTAMNVGVSLIFSSQDVPGEIRGVLGQVEHRFEFAMDHHGALIESLRFGKNAAIEREGCCFYSRTGTDIIKIGYADTDDVRRIIGRIKEKYKDSPMKLVTRGEPLPYEDVSRRGFVCGNAQAVKDFCGRKFRARLGSYVFPDPATGDDRAEQAFDRVGRTLCVMGEYVRALNVEGAIISDYIYLLGASGHELTSPPIFVLDLLSEGDSRAVSAQRGAGDTAGAAAMFDKWRASGAIAMPECADAAAATEALDAFLCESAPVPRLLIINCAEAVGYRANRKLGSYIESHELVGRDDLFIVLHFEKFERNYDLMHSAVDGAINRAVVLVGGTGRDVLLRNLDAVADESLSRKQLMNRLSGNVKLADGSAYFCADNECRSFLPYTLFKVNQE